MNLEIKQIINTMPTKLTKEKVETIFSADEYFPNVGDSLFKGMKLLSKYIDIHKNEIIHGSDHDVVYGPDIQELIQLGLTEKDAITLYELNWSICENGDNFCVYL